jgi:hypothetical protein
MFVGHFDLEELEMGDSQTSNNTPYRATCRSAYIMNVVLKPGHIRRAVVLLVSIVLLSCIRLDDQKEMRPGRSFNRKWKDKMNKQMTT